MPAPTRTAVLLYPGVTPLDFVGPAQFLSRLSHIDYVSLDREAVPTDAGFGVMPTASIAEVVDADILCIPGGLNVVTVMDDDRLMDWVQSVGSRAKWVTSVCTGSLILGAAGLLRGYDATSHWAWRDHLELFGATPADARTVIDRNRITGGGVTAGVDFALTLISQIWGRQTAEVLQLALEYDPMPPLDSGSPARASTQTKGLHDHALEQIAPERAERLITAAARNAHRWDGS